MTELVGKIVQALDPEAQHICDEEHANCSFQNTQVFTLSANLRDAQARIETLHSELNDTNCTKSNISVTILIWSLTLSSACLWCLGSNGRLFIYHTPARIISISLTLFVFMERFVMMNTFQKGANIQPGLQMDQAPLTGMTARKTSTHQPSTTIHPIARQLPLSNLSTESMWLPNTNTCLNPLPQPHLSSPLFIHLSPLVKRKSLKVWHLVWVVCLQRSFKN